MSYAEIFQPQRQDGKMQVHWLDFVVIGMVAAAVWYFYNQVNTVLHYNWDWSTIPVYIFRWDADEGQWVSNLIVQGSGVRWNTLLYYCLIEQKQSEF